MSNLVQRLHENKTLNQDAFASDQTLSEAMQSCTRTRTRTRAWRNNRIALLLHHPFAHANSSTKFFATIKVAILTQAKRKAAQEMLLLASVHCLRSLIRVSL